MLHVCVESCIFHIAHKSITFKIDETKKI